MANRFTHRINIFADEAYIKEEKSYCSSGEYGSYDTLSDAQSTCTSDANCAAIFDNFCDKVGFKLCSTGYVKKKSWSSCLYIKNQGKESGKVTSIAPPAMTNNIPSTTETTDTAITMITSAKTLDDPGRYRDIASLIDS